MTFIQYPPHRVSNQPPIVCPTIHQTTIVERGDDSVQSLVDWVADLEEQLEVLHNQAMRFTMKVRNDGEDCLNLHQITQQEKIENLEANLRDVEDFLTNEINVSIQTLEQMAQTRLIQDKVIEQLRESFRLLALDVGGHELRLNKQLPQWMPITLSILALIFQLIWVITHFL